MNRYVNKIVELYTRGKVDNSAKDEFHKWLVNEQYSEEKEEALLALWNNTDNVAEEDMEGSLQAVKLKSRFLAGQKASKQFYWKYAAAIVVAVCVTSAYIFTRNASPDVSFIEYYSKAGQSDSFKLPDGSLVYANSKTVIFYPESFGKTTRTLYLSGQANFKVVQNARIPFVVKVKDFSVTALGTEFDVSSYPEDPYFTATLIRGSIKVGQKNKAEMHLEVRDRFAYDRLTGKRSIAQVYMYDATAWQRGELVFIGATIKETLSVLERQYGVSYQYNSGTINNDRFNFRFKKGSTLPEIMDIIKKVADDFDYKVVGDVYYINLKNQPSGF